MWRRRVESGNSSRRTPLRCRPGCRRLISESRLSDWCVGTNRFHFYSPRGLKALQMWQDQISKGKKKSEFSLMKRSIHLIMRIERPKTWRKQKGDLAEIPNRPPKCSRTSLEQQTPPIAALECDWVARVPIKRSGREEVEIVVVGKAGEEKLQIGREKKWHVCGECKKWRQTKAASG